MRPIGAYSRRWGNCSLQGVIHGTFILLLSFSFENKCIIRPEYITEGKAKENKYGQLSYRILNSHCMLDKT